MLLRTLQDSRYVDCHRHGDERFVLKVVRRSDFDYFEDLYRRLEPCPYVRLLHDTVHDPPTFVFKYLREDLLSLVDRDMPITVTKRILKDALRGIAALHAKDIIHTGKEKSRHNLILFWIVHENKNSKIQT